MNKKILLITAALAVVSFGGMFVVGWLKKPPEIISSSETTQEVEAAQLSEWRTVNPAESLTNSFNNQTPAISQASMTEQQLQALIFELRKKMDDYDAKLQSLQDREQQTQIAQELLNQDIEKLNNLRVELASMTANLKSEQDRLLKSKIEIDKIEQTNLVSIAATYDQMKPDSAGEIISNMCSVVQLDSETGRQIDGTGAGFEDAVKILYYMTERAKAKLLAELSSSEPQLAVALSRRLKMITEVN